MKCRNQIRDLESLCAEVRPDDGIPAWLLKKQERAFARSSPQGAAGRGEIRSRQYCKAVRLSLESVLSGLCADGSPGELSILTVEPLHGGGSLLVVAAAPPGCPADELPVMERALQDAAGLLRSLVAGDVRRKRTPHLTFRVVPAPPPPANALPGAGPETEPRTPIPPDEYPD